MRYIDHEEIYRLTNQGLDIFKYYFPNDDITSSKTFVKLREEDKTDSVHFSLYKDFWRITDFGNQGEMGGMTAIEFVKWREGISHYDALIYIEQVIIRKEIKGGEYKSIKFAPIYEYSEMTPDDKKGEYKFIYKANPEESDFSAIGRYVDEDTLEYFNCRCVESYSYCGNHKKLNKDVIHHYKATKDYPIFVFDYGDFKKLYRPHEVEKKWRFIYIGKKPTNYVFGLEQIKNCDDEFASNDEENPIKKPDDKPLAKVIDLFRCSGESDALNLHSLGFHAYWINSESANFDYAQFKEVDQYCENHYQIMDLDATGINQAVKNALKHIDIYNVELPEWLMYKNDWRGNPCKDLKDFINTSGSDRSQTYYNFLVLKKNARRVKFWSKSKDKNKINYNIDMEDFFFFLKCNGFYIVESSYHKKSDYCYAKISDKIVELIAPDGIKRLIKRFTKDWIKSRNRMDAKDILNKMNTSVQISEANLDSIEKIQLNFKNYSRDTEYIHFKNGSLKITKDKIEKIKNDDVPNNILGKLVVNNKIISHLIQKEIRLIKEPAVEVKATEEYQKLLDELAVSKTPESRQDINIKINELPDIDKYDIKINDDSFIFLSFLRDLAAIHWRKELELKLELTEKEKKEQNLVLANLLFVIGYHCQQYKDPGKPWITFLQDMLISDVGKSSGGSGKSLLSKAATFVRASFYKDGKLLTNPNELMFLYDGFTEFHDYIEVDDFHEHADFNIFYNQASGKRFVNPKNYSAITLDYENSGKLLISSNYELPNTHGSTLRRLLSAGVSDYYHEASKHTDYKESRSPLTKYGRSLYDDFTEEEWNKFYNLIAYCIQINQRFFRINTASESLEKRQLKKIMSQGLGLGEDFMKWANDYFVKYDGEVLPSISDESNIVGYFNTYVIKDAAFENFKTKLTKKQQMDYKINKFTVHLEAWAEFWGYELNPIHLCNGAKGTKRIIKTIEKKSTECIYINRYPEISENDKGEEDVLPF